MLSAASRVATAARSTRDYVTICISTYPGDLLHLDRAVARLQAAGVRRASRSRLIRAAIMELDVDALIARELAAR